MAVRTVLVGLGGYGNGYVDAMLDHGPQIGVEIAGFVDPAPHGCVRREEAERAAGRIDASLEEFYERSDADLVIIAAPIHFHAPYTLTALAHGSNVLCEKPIAGSVEEALHMQAAAADARRSVAIGYQWSYSDPVLDLTRDIAAGRFGAPIDLRGLAFWPRTKSYYARASWAGRLFTPDGRPVFDSPVNNATAHYLHNAFFVLGREAAAPVRVQAELYRANPIESFDTAAVRVETASGATVLFYVSHAVPSRVGPIFSYRFERATVSYVSGGNVVARLADGTLIDYGNPDSGHLEKLTRVAAEIRDGREPACTIADALPHLQTVRAIHESCEIRPFPEELLRRTVVRDVGADDDELLWVEGVEAAFTAAYGDGVLPSQLAAVGFATAGRIVDVT